MKIMKTTVKPSIGHHASGLTIRAGDRAIHTGLTSLTQLKRLLKVVPQLDPAISSIILGKKLSLTDALGEWTTWLASAGNERTNENKTFYVAAWLRDMKLGSKSALEITERDISPWINNPKSTDKRTTRHGKRSAIRSFFHYLLIQRACLRNPAMLVPINMKLLSHDQKEVRIKTPFTRADYKALEDTIVEHLQYLHAKTKAEGIIPAVQQKIQWLQFWRDAIVIGRNTALRLGDIAQLEWACVKPEAVTVWTDKRDRRVHLIIRDMPDPKAFRDTIATIPRKGPYLFPEQRAIAIDPKKRAELSFQFTRLLAKAGVNGHSFHDIRHGFATECYKRGKPLWYITNDLGHTDSKTTKGYIHV